MTDPTPESAETTDDLDAYPVPFLQHLIDTGDAWKAEGALGRAAVAAIEDGRCVLGGVAHRDYFGNVVHARREVPPGEKGSLSYANRHRAARGEPPLSEQPDGSVSAARS